MIDPRDPRLLMENELLRRKHFTAENLGIGSVYGLAPYGLAVVGRGAVRPAAELVIIAPTRGRNRKRANSWLISSR